MILTHVELAYKACHVIVFEVFGQNLFGKSTLVKNMEAGARLEWEKQAKKETCLCFDYSLKAQNRLHVFVTESFNVHPQAISERRC